MPDQHPQAKDPQAKESDDQSLEVRTGQTPPGLSLWRFWFTVGMAMVALVVYLSVANFHVPQLPSTFGDKINHCIAYGTLMLWFGQLFQAHRSRIVVTLLLIVLGMAMEFVQAVLPYRFFDWFDMLANVAGVVLGACLLIIGADKLLAWLEARVLSSRY